MKWQGYKGATRDGACEVIADEKDGRLALSKENRNKSRMGRLKVVLQRLVWMERRCWPVSTVASNTECAMKYKCAICVSRVASHQCGRFSTSSDDCHSFRDFLSGWLHPLVLLVSSPLR